MSHFYFCFMLKLNNLARDKCNEPWYQSSLKGLLINAKTYL